jgi:hypothetical protein
MRPGIQPLRVGVIELDAEVQSRARHNPDAIRDFSEAHEAGQ